jgi:hypothetical protein
MITKSRKMTWAGYAVSTGKKINAYKAVFKTALKTYVYTGLFKRSIHFQKFILQKLLTLNPCPVYGRKGNLSKF